MFDLIIDKFFYKKESKPLTYLSEIKTEKKVAFIKKSHTLYNGVGTTLSKYFAGSMGLNTIERVSNSNRVIINERNPR